MKQSNAIKLATIILFSLVLFLGCVFIPKPETKILNTATDSEQIIEGTDEVAAYKNWTKVNEQPELMPSTTAHLCARPTKERDDIDAKDPHKDKFINVYVNAIGKDEMLTKKNPKFAVGTVIVKEKLPSPDSKNPELLTVMIKRQKDFNPEVGDWEFMTLNGEATQVTATGKLESCQSCHINYKQNDYISRMYLPIEKRKKLK